MKFLGISPSHDSSVCIIEDGRIVKFLKEERLTRVKRDSRPIRALSKILEDVDSIDNFMYAPPQEGSHDNYFDEWKHFIEKFTGLKSSVDLSSDHHRTHAALAFYNSGFKEASVIVVDAAGSRIGDLIELESIFYSTYPASFLPIYKNFQRINNKYSGRPEELKQFPDCEIVTDSMMGIVSSYCSATLMIGENALENGKTMGLSSYGKDVGLPPLFEEGRAVVDNTMFLANTKSQPVFKDYMFMDTNKVTKDNYQFYADYSWHIQKQTEQAMIVLIEKAIEKTNCKNICITGGYGLNVVANSLYLKKFPEINFYFEPFADDGGNSIGAAMFGYRVITEDKTINKINHTFHHGSLYDLSEIENYGNEFNEKDVARIIKEQKSVAVYYKLGEAGPRALGHRSILFDARNPKAKDLVNIIKNREWYRPFAAACLEEDAHKYFNIFDNDGYEFMTINADANDLAKDNFPGVIHVDGTCRIQVVKDPDEPLYKVLQEFKKITGLGILLNTSFNLAGEAMVETPEDAISTYKRSEISCLWFPEVGRALIKL